MTSAILSLLVVSALPAAGAAAPPAPSPAPAFTFHDLGGAPRTLAEFRGHVTLLEFWASWCLPCRKGFPFLDDLQAKHAAAGLKVVAVTMETDDDAVRAFLAERPGRFLVGRDPSGSGGEIFEVNAMPTSVLLDREGRVLARFEGGTDSVHRQLEEAVEAALGGGEVQAPSASNRRRGRTAGVRAWERGYLADPIMSLDGDALTRSMRDHIHTSKEAAAGGGGVAGGGCGCN